MKKYSNPKWHAFIEQFNNFKDLHEVEAFFDTILTATEKVEFANRLCIIKELLLNKETQRDIAKNLKVSLANVTRGSNVLKTSKYDLKKLLKID
ncbi:MAG: trp operon repressor [Neisseriaceae bacterium]